MQAGDLIFSFFLYMLIHLEVTKSSFLASIQASIQHAIIVSKLLWQINSHLPQRQSYSDNAERLSCQPVLFTSSNKLKSQRKHYLCPTKLVTKFCGTIFGKVFCNCFFQLHSNSFTSSHHLQTLLVRSIVLFRCQVLLVSATSIIFSERNGSSNMIFLQHLPLQ